MVPEQSNQNNAALKPNQGAKPTEGVIEMNPGQEKGAPEQKKGDPGTPKPSRGDDHRTCLGCRFPLLIALLQLVLGISITAVAFLMAGISTSLLVRDTPHWAGITVVVVSLLGLCLYCITYQIDEQTSFHFGLKLVFFLLCVLSMIICILALAFAAHHYSQIAHFACDLVMADCKCKLDPKDHIARTIIYKNVSDCSAITSHLKLYLLLEIVLNMTVSLVCFVGCFLMWKHRYQVFYAGVRKNSLTILQVQQQKP
ncbi:sarcospan [Protopterus annectens]|uniref:sarcospan n=1 Tax=Protopterus annectens TaxID=7888 RepID=UPI001CFB300D|nr:sarcospan [Protopterus annectens]